MSWLNDHIASKQTSLTDFDISFASIVDDVIQKETDEPAQEVEKDKGGEGDQNNIKIGES